MLDAATLRSKLQRTLQLEFSSLSVGGARVSEGLGTLLETADKAKVLQESRCFNASPANPLHCRRVIAKILYLLQHGVSLSEEETSGLFFGLTRLFHSKDDKLRRLLYLLLRQLSVSAAEAFVVTSSLTRDAADANPCHRANALRCLSVLADASVAAQTERCTRNGLADASPLVCSAALLCGLTLLSVAAETVKRWAGEVQGLVGAQSPFVSSLALLLLLQLKQGDRTAQIKAVAAAVQQQQGAAAVSRGPVAEVVLLRLAANLLQREADAKIHEALLVYLEAGLRSNSDMVVLEASRALTRLAAAAQQQQQQQGQGGWRGYGRLVTYNMGPAFAALTNLCSSSKPAARFAAVRALSLLSNYSVCTAQLSAAAAALEGVLGDSNKAAAATAVSVLLKSASEANVERLISLVSSVVVDASATEALKLSLISSVLSLSLHYPKKHRPLLSFLGATLREEGSLRLKTAAVNAMLLLLQHIPSAREACLSSLCEFIEDCEYPVLCSKVLCLLGDEAASWGAAAAAPLQLQQQRCRGDSAAAASNGSLMRFILNRIVLEGATVRAAGVDALAKVAQHCSSRREDVLLLLAVTAATDPDDEVRDRAFATHQALQQQQQKQQEQQREDDCSSTTSTEAGGSGIEGMLDAKPPVSLDCLCSSLAQHLQHQETTDALFDVSGLPEETEKPRQQLPLLLAPAAAATPAAPTGAAGLSVGGEGLLPHAAAAAARTASPSAAAAGGGGAAAAAAAGGRDAELLSVFESLQAAAAAAADPAAATAAAGDRFKLFASSRPQRLTEEEAEYGVTAILHAFVSEGPQQQAPGSNKQQTSFSLMAEFVIHNTLERQTLTEVSPRVAAAACPWNTAACLPVPLLEAGESSSSYLLLATSASDPAAAAAAVRSCASMPAALSFVLREEGDEFGCSDEYPLEALSITPAHFIKPQSLGVASFVSLWDSMAETEVLTKLSLPLSSPAAAVDALLTALGLGPCEGTEAPPNSSSSSLELLLAGVFIEGQQVLAKAVCLFPGENCLLRLAIRSPDPSLCEALCVVLE